MSQALRGVLLSIGVGALVTGLVGLRWAPYQAAALGAAAMVVTAFVLTELAADVYFDLRDWWVGYYRGDGHHYVLILPTLVVRWVRTPSPVERLAELARQMSVPPEVLGLPTANHWSALLPAGTSVEEEAIRADERAKVSEALRRSALLVEARLRERNDWPPETAALLLGGIQTSRRQADLLDAVTANGGHSDGIVL